MTQKLSADFSRRIFLEGRAPARPQNFGTVGAVPSDFSPNKFGALKIRHQLTKTMVASRLVPDGSQKTVAHKGRRYQKFHHQPLVKASGMKSFGTPLHSLNL